MHRGRMSFGITYFNHNIYVVGGVGDNRTLLPHCEKYNIYGYKDSSNKTVEGWEELPSLKETRFSSSLIILKHRYLYCLASAVLSRVEEEESDSEDDDLDRIDSEEQKAFRLQKKVNIARDDIIKKSGRYMSKRKVKELEDKLFLKIKAKMAEEYRDKEERRQARETRRIERERRQDKMRMLRKTPSGTMFFNLIERLDLDNPIAWEYVDIKTCELNTHSQLGMIELSHDKIIVFGGANVDAGNASAK